MSTLLEHAPDKVPGKPRLDEVELKAPIQPNDTDFLRKIGSLFTTAKVRGQGFIANLAEGSSFGREPAEFKEALSNPIETLCSDSLIRQTWVIPARETIEAPAAIVVLPAWGINNSRGMGRQNLLEFHYHFPTCNLVAIGNEGMESSLPNVDWFRNTNFWQMAQCRLEVMQHIKSIRSDLDLDSYSIIGESMGTINGLLMCAKAGLFGQQVKQLFAIGPAGIERADIAELFLKFIAPEAKDLIDRIRTTPKEKLPQYLVMLLGTANIPPKVWPVLLKQASLIATKPAPLEGIGRLVPTDTRIVILAGSRDFVANPEAFEREMVTQHGNTYIIEYPDESHMTLTRSHKVANRVAKVFHAPFENSLGRHLFIQK